MSVANHRCTFRPVRAGTQIVLPDNNNESGTIGLILTDGVDPWLLTCRHVIARSTGALVAMDRIFQSKPNDGMIATLADVVDDQPLDCAAVKLLVPASDDVLGIGKVGTVTPPVVGMRVIKSGWKTGISEGQIQQVVGADVLIERLPGYPVDYLLAGQGDSGAVWVDAATLSPVALHNRESAVGPHRAFGVDIRAVLQSLNLQPMS